jgi:methionyl-tRNA formyltransferase
MRRIAFMGSKSGGLALLRLLCERSELPTPVLALCPDDRQDERSCWSEFESLCAAQGMPMRTVTGAQETEAALSAAAPDVVIVHGWYRLIPLERLDATRFFGFHYSPLPAYRGNAPLVWQILRGEPRLGVSFFRFGAGIDDGDLVDQRLFDFGPDETIADALRRAEAACLEISLACLPPLLAGTLKPRPQVDAGVSYCGLRIPADGCIDWTASARQVHDFVRAQAQPYPGAFTHLSDGRRLTIWRTAVDTRRHHATPGAVVGVEGPEVVVACGADSAVRVLACRCDGQEDAAPASLIGSLRVRLGSAVMQR